MTQLALDFRQQFKKDVVIDLVCFRKLGHNEQDEPFITQPLMYKKISQHPGTRKLYADKLATQGVIQAGDADAMIKQFRADLDAGKHSSNPVISNFKSKFAVDWAPYLNTKWTDAAETHVPLAELQRLAERVTSVPEDFRVHPTVQRVLQARRQMAEGKLPVDWGMAENLAYASLVSNGYDVRLSGQDTGARHLLAPACRAARPGPRALGLGHLRAAAEHRRRTRARSWSSTRCCPRRRCSASSTATRPPSRPRW